MVPIRSEAGPWALASGVPAGLCYAAWLGGGGAWMLSGFVVFTAALVFVLYFFRDPEREPEESAADVWLAPADGVVTGIEDEEGRRRIVIFLTVFNVHVNRMPRAGTVVGREYRGGRFLPAFRGNLEETNERHRVLCRDDRDREYEVWQIAGLLARRIHFWMGVGSTFERGERFGMISFGSRTDLLLPPGVQPEVEPGATVRGGHTVVARG